MRPKHNNVIFLKKHNSPSNKKRNNIDMGHIYYWNNPTIKMKWFNFLFGNSTIARV